MDIEDKFEALFANKLEPNEARAFLIALYEQKESAKEIAIAASVMRKHSIRLNLPKTLQENAIDIVGTGGDKSGSFNISTTVSLLLASMGCVVAKHGNRSITSKSGSTDVLEALGINLDLSIENKIKMLEATGFCFFPATDHHPAMRHIMPIRKSISHRTIFNILGPLTNPAGATKYLLGVFDPSYVMRMAQALVALNAKKAYVVSAYDGMDEIGISGLSAFALVQEGTITQGDINPEDYGLALAPKEAIQGGDASHNAHITKNIFLGKERGAKRDIVLLNASYALLANGGVRDIQEALEMANAGLDSGKAFEHLTTMAHMSQQLA